MATPETKIDFTVGDQQTLARIEVNMKKVLNKLAHLPCQDEAIKPCPQENRMVAIEQKANKAVMWIQGIIATLLAGGILAGASAFLTHIAE
jgi:hypothetical protein